jgi:hypothetical protein
LQSDIHFSRAKRVNGFGFHDFQAVILGGPDFILRNRPPQRRFIRLPWQFHSESRRYGVQELALNIEPIKKARPDDLHAGHGHNPRCHRSWHSDRAMDEQPKERWRRYRPLQQ